MPTWSVRAARALVIWIACGLLWTVQSYAYLKIRNRLGQYTFFTLARHDISVALIWAAIAPLVMAATARIPLTTTRWLPRGTAYLVGMAIIEGTGPRDRSGEHPTSPIAATPQQLLARLGDYLRVAIECSDDDGITASRAQSLARSLAQFERVVAVSAEPTSLSSP